MSNMSYCRFENTSNDLEDCKVALEDMLHGNNEEDGIPMVLSRSELQFAQLLVVSCLDIVRLIAEEACIEAEDLDEMNVEEKLRNAIFSANEGAQKEKEDVEMEREEAEERQEAMKKTAEQATAAKEPTTTVERPTFVTDTMLRFLDELRESGATNMYGARPYVHEMFNELTVKQAGDVVGYWMATFSERHPQKEGSTGSRSRIRVAGLGLKRSR